MNHTTADLESLTKQLRDFFRHEAFIISRIPGGASSRRYYKIHFTRDQYFPVPTVALMHIPDTDSQMLPDYVNINYYFRRFAVPTPRVFEIRQDQGWVFEEFIEWPTLEAHLNQHPQDGERILGDTLEFICDMQQKCRVEQHCPAFQRRFDYEKYMYEFNFHVSEQLLKFYFQSSYDKVALQEFAHEISTTLNIAETVFVHRDFQSSNIFVNAGEAETQFSVIDFQDARQGIPVYDVVACLWDSYIDIPESLREDLLSRYFQFLPRLGLNWEWERFRQLIDYTIIQRKLHDAGAFAYNYRRFRSKRYLKYISEALDMVLVPLQKYPQFSTIRELLERLRRD